MCKGRQKPTVSCVLLAGSLVKFLTPAVLPELCLVKQQLKKWNRLSLTRSQTSSQHHSRAMVGSSERERGEGGLLTVWEVGLIAQARAVEQLLLELQRLLSPDLHPPPTPHTLSTVSLFLTAVPSSQAAICVATAVNEAPLISSNNLQHGPPVLQPLTAKGGNAWMKAAVGQQCMPQALACLLLGY